MRRKDEAFSSPPAVGGVSLLVVFAVLCLTVFALLSLTTVRADERVSTAAAKAVSDYYSADCEAQMILAQLREGEVPEGVLQSENLYAYQCPISETQTLAVEVRLEYNEFEVIRWEAIASGKWEPDINMHLWLGVAEE